MVDGRGGLSRSLPYCTPFPLSPRFIESERYGKGEIEMASSPAPFSTRPVDCIPLPEQSTRRAQWHDGLR